MWDGQLQIFAEVNWSSYPGAAFAVLPWGAHGGVVGRRICFRFVFGPLDLTGAAGLAKKNPGRANVGHCHTASFDLILINATS